MRERERGPVKTSAEQEGPDDRLEGPPTRMSLGGYPWIVSEAARAPSIALCHSDYPQTADLEPVSGGCWS